MKKIGTFFAEKLRRWFPDTFVFALILTIAIALLAIFVEGSSPLETIQAWYKGFWMLLKFSMEMVLILVTSYALALSPIAGRFIDSLAKRIHSPIWVYASVVLVGTIGTYLSWGLIVLAAVLGRELAMRVKGVDYTYLVACAYLAFTPWVAGLSSSIPLLLNTENNFLIEQGVLSETISISHTLGSTLNLVYMIFFLIMPPVLLIWLRPTDEKVIEFGDLKEDGELEKVASIEDEASQQKLDGNAFSDMLNNSKIIQFIIGAMGLTYIIWHFATKGFELDLDFMIFVFLIIGMFLHLTPLRYVIAMKRASRNISGIVLQYQFYAGIMGMMIYTGLGKSLSAWMASVASVKTLPFFAFMSGGILNFAIPSAGGEWAVIGPTILETAQTLGAEMSPSEMTDYISRISLSVAYGETLTNLLQPFFFLLIAPIMTAGVKIRARDVLGYMVIPFLVYLIFDLVVIMWVPM